MKSTTNLTINDEEFKQSVSLADAYRILERFIVQYNNRGESDTVALLTDTGIMPDGSSSDPAQLYDFLDCARQILGH